MKVVVDIDICETSAGNEGVAPTHKVSPNFDIVVIDQLLSTHLLILKINRIYCMIMLEDQIEEQACLYVLGLLDPDESKAFEALLGTDPAAGAAKRAFEESMTGLVLSVTPSEVPSEDLKARVVDAVEARPARVATDVHGHVSEINPAFTRMCGYTFAELAGRKPGHLLQGPKSDPETVRQLREAVRDQKACDIEMANYHKDGSAYWVRIRIEPLRDSAGACVGFEAIEHQTDPPHGIVL